MVCVCGLKLIVVGWWGVIIVYRVVVNWKNYFLWNFDMLFCVL